MTVVAFTSAAGAPGVTVTALAAALRWPRSVLLVEADVSGHSSILAGYLRGEYKHQHGLLDIAMALRQGADIDAALQAASMPLPVRRGSDTAASQARLLPALATPSQARVIAPMWDQLPIVFQGLEQSDVDVLLDAGRLGAIGGPLPVLRRADMVVLVTRSSLPAVAAVRAAAAELRDDLETNGVGGDTLHLLVVGDGQPYRAREISRAVGVEVMGSVAFDPVNAEVYSVGAAPSRKFDQSSLSRSVTQLTATLDHLTAARRDRLTPRHG